MSTKSAAELVKRAAVQALTGDLSKPRAVAELTTTLNELAETLRGTPHEALAREAHGALERASRAGDARAALDRIGEHLDALEHVLAVGGTSKIPAASSTAGSSTTESNAIGSGAALSVASSTTETSEAGSPEAGPSAASLRDAETVELFCDFLSESEDGLDKADEILLHAEQNGADSEQVNALFRVFHSIKGVSACLDAGEVTTLAHVTETLLGRVRDGKLTLSGAAVDAVLEASAGMRRLLAAVRGAVDADAPIPADRGAPALIRLIEAASALPTAGAPDGAVKADEPAAAAAPAGPSPPELDAAAGARLRETVKVDLERIDSVVEMIGELIIVESMVVNTPEIAALSSLRVRNYLGQLTKISRDLQNVAMRMRMVPVRGAFQKMARLTRDLSRKTGKDAQLLQFGESTEMDRSMVERIEDPLMHMIRNALDHALESPEERRAAGKPATGTLRLSARHEGGSIAIELSDDGRGLLREPILKKARQQGLIQDSGAQLSDAEVYSLIFLPGFSTAAQVTEISGRGVGMDVVKRNVEEMRGRVEVTSTHGRGTTFKLILPLTLAIIDGMLIACGGERYIVPSLSIVQSFKPDADTVRTPCDRGELITVRGEILPLLRLRQLFEIAGSDPPVERAHVVVVESAGKKVGLLVDDVLTQQQVVIKPLGEALSESEFLAGGAILSDGLVGLILNVDRLVSLFGGARRGPLETREIAA